MATTYVVQRRKPPYGLQNAWMDVSSHDTEDEARTDLRILDERVAILLGPFRLIRREETEI